MKTDFWASRNHFLPFSQTAVNSYQWKQFSISPEHIGNQVFICFCLSFYSEFFSVSENYYSNQGEAHFLKTNHIPASGHQFFQYFQRFFKVEAAFPYGGNVFFNILHLASKNEFSSQQKQYFFRQCNFSASRNHYWNKERIVLRKRAHYCQWTTDFPASENNFFFIICRPVPVSFSIQCKSIFQGHPFFWLVETDFRANNGFCKEEKAVNKKKIRYPIDRNSDCTSQN